MAAMASSDQPRTTIIAWALFLIFFLVAAGICAILFSDEVIFLEESGPLPGAIMLSTACLSLTLLARPTR